MSQPFLNWPSSSKDFNFTSSKGIKCCNGRIWVQFNYNNIPPACCTFSCWSQCFHRRADHWRGKTAYFRKYKLWAPRDKYVKNRSSPWFWFFSACFCQNSLSHQHPTWRNESCEQNWKFSPGTPRGWPEVPKHPSTRAIRRAFASEFTAQRNYTRISGQ